METMTIKEFLDGRNHQESAVRAYIARHLAQEEQDGTPEEKCHFKGHVSRKGTTYLIDEVAFDALEQRYPLAKPIQQIVDHPRYQELEEKYLRLLEEQHEMERLYRQQAAEMLEYKDVKLMLERRESDLTAAETAKTAAEAAATAAQAETEALRQQLAEAQAAADAAKAEAERIAAEKTAAESRAEAAEQAQKTAEESAEKMRTAGLLQRIRGWKR